MGWTLKLGQLPLANLKSLWPAYSTFKTLYYTNTPHECSKTYILEWSLQHCYK